MIKKMLVMLFLAITLNSCNEPVLYKSEYTVIDTLNVSTNAFEMVLGYDVLILNHYDSLLYFGEMNDNGCLTSMENRPVNFKLK